jgi:hypothetical protein
MFIEFMQVFVHPYAIPQGHINVITDIADQAKTGRGGHGIAAIVCPVAYK